MRQFWATSAVLVASLLLVVGCASPTSSGGNSAVATIGSAPADKQAAAMNAYTIAFSQGFGALGTEGSDDGQITIVGSSNEDDSFSYTITFADYLYSGASVPTDKMNGTFTVAGNLTLDGTFLGSMTEKGSVTLQGTYAATVGIDFSMTFTETELKAMGKFTVDGTHYSFSSTTPNPTAE